MSSNGLTEGSRVILKKGEDYKSCIVEKNCKIKMGKMRFSLGGLIGQKYGTLLQIEGEELCPIVSQPSDVVSQPSDVQAMDVQGCSTERSNKNLIESDDNQKIKQDEILQMKESGMTGEEIVGKLVENSQTFQNKTEFSQEKYIKRKKDKHISVVRVLKPTTRLVFQMFYCRCPSDVGYMRVDTFSQIMAFSNLIPGSNIAVIDTYKGLLVAAVLEQLGGTGSVTQLIPNNIFLKDCLKYYNLSEASLDSHYHYNIENLVTLEADANKDENVDLASSSATTSIVGMECEPAIDNNQSANGNEGNSTDTTKPDTETSYRKRKREEKKKKTPEELEVERQTRLKNSEKRKKAQKILLEKNLDGLILSSKFHPSPLVMRMLEFINPSRPVVVYSQNQEPLIDCYMKVKGSGRGLNLQVTETWYREYQVLPQRTHPTVRMSGNGGYLLTFTTASPPS